MFTSRKGRRETHAILQHFSDWDNININSPEKCIKNVNWLEHSEFVSVVLNKVNFVSCQMKLQSDTEVWGTVGPDRYSK